MDSTMNFFKPSKIDKFRADIKKMVLDQVIERGYLAIEMNPTSSYFLRI